MAIDHVNLHDDKFVITRIERSMDRTFEHGRRPRDQNGTAFCLKPFQTCKTLAKLRREISANQNLIIAEDTDADVPGSPEFWPGCRTALDSYCDERRLERCGRKRRRNDACGRVFYRGAQCRYTTREAGKRITKRA